MANLTLCRFARSVSGLARLIPRNDRLSSTSSYGFLTKSVSPFSTCVKCPSKVATRSMQFNTRKVLSELPALSVIKCRMSSATGDHVRLWQIERIVSAAFVALLPGCLILQNPAVDGLFAVLVVMHAHWGLEAVIVDYARPSVVGNILPKVAHLSLYLLSAGTLVGLLALIYNGPGIGKSVMNFWAIGSGSAPAQRA